MRCAFFSLICFFILLSACELSVTSEASDSESSKAVLEESSEKSPEEKSIHDADSDQADLSPFDRDRRGDEHLFAGRFDDAIADYDAFLKERPEFDAQHWRRGIAYYYAERYKEGAAQFERHRVVNPDDVENAAWHFLCQARALGVDKARAAILPVGPDQRDPMKAVYRLYAGRAKPADVLEEAQASTQRDALFFAHLYLALYFDVLGETDRAETHIGKATGEYGRSHYMGQVAQVHARVLAD